LRAPTGVRVVCNFVRERGEISAQVAMETKLGRHFFRVKTTENE
jgi:hypothetical protein